MPNILRSSVRYVVLWAALLTLACRRDGGAGEPQDIQFVFSVDSLTLAEGGAAGEIHVSLAQAPLTPVNVAVTVSGPGIIASPDTLSFTEDNFDVPRPVFIVPVNDDDLATNIDSVAFDRLGAAPRWLKVTKNDDDVQNLVIDSASVMMVEGTVVFLGVRLAYQPAAADSITVTFTVPGVATSIPTRRIYTPANWNIAQSFKLTGTQDIDALDDVTVMWFTGFHGPDITDIELTVLDDD